MTGVASGELRFEEAGLRVGMHRLDDIFDVAVEEGGQVVPGVADAVVGHPVLGEVVGTDLLGALAGADLGAAGRLDLPALPALLRLEGAVAVEVWMRPLASVTGTRWTRWTPLSYLRREKAPRPCTSKMISFKPPRSLGWESSSSTVQP